MIRNSEALKKVMENDGAFILVFGSSIAVYVNGNHMNVAQNAFRAVRAKGFFTSYIHEYSKYDRQLRYIKR